MRKILILTVAIIGLAGCADSPNKDDGKRRHITLYSADGHVIKTWTLEKAECSCNGRDDMDQGWDRFYINGEPVKISGTIVSEVE